MDGVHDLGGREGFGRVYWEDDEGYESFHADWEARLFAMAMQLFAQWRGKPELWTLDWFRHVRERLDPVDYLTRPYFDQWAQCLFAILIDNDVVTLAEVIGDQGTAVAMPEGKRAQAPAAESARDGAAAPAFQVGTPVRTASLIGSDHTRLPGYVRGRRRRTIWRPITTRSYRRWRRCCTGLGSWGPTKLRPAKRSGNGRIAIPSMASQSNCAPARNSAGAVPPACPL